ncbi:MAG: hypothetical protein MOP49_1284, partial [Nitrososphaera sp.]|nr:hypothetical protein [Nitrososphaera sp.]
MEGKGRYAVRLFEMKRKTRESKRYTNWYRKQKSINRDS